jgi:hypothetical protein
MARQLVIPRQGVGAFYGASQAFKSFIAQDLSFHVALGWECAGRRVTQAPVCPDDRPGWFSGLRDRHVGVALQLIHGNPSKDWTLDVLAHEAQNALPPLQA